VRVSSGEALTRVRQLLRQVPLIDGHNDLAWRIRTDGKPPADVSAYDLRKPTPGHTDLARLARGQVGAQVWSVFLPGDIKDRGFARVQLEQIDLARRVIARYPDQLALALSADDVEREFGRGRIASMIGMEGGHGIENSLGVLRACYALGARYLTLTHNVTTDWADAAVDSARHDGLSPFGREVIREMNRLGMMVDISHVSPAAMNAALDTTEAPLIFSHSNARALVDHPRNVPDAVLARIAGNGGMAMATFVPAFVCKEVTAFEQMREAEDKRLAQAVTDKNERQKALAAWDSAHPRPRATLAQVADHVEHVREIAGADHIGIGSDFDGIETVPVGLEDVSKFPDLLAELAQRGWSDADLAKLAGRNFLRVFREVEAVAKRLQREREPSVRTIEELDGARSQ
jgi:membrane dipeptidase